MAKIIAHDKPDDDGRPAGREIAADGSSLPAGAAKPVVLVQMPFGYLYRPTLSLSLLKALLLGRRIPARLFYSTFRAFFERVASDVEITVRVSRMRSVSLELLDPLLIAAKAVAMVEDLSWA